MQSLLLTLSLAITGDPCAQQGDPALPIALDATFNELELDFKGAVLVETGFPFSFYGRDYNSVWINGNGTLSFCQPVTSKTGGLMPSLGRPLIAPFWAAADPLNCDTMTGAGRVWFRNDANRLVVVWDHMGLCGTYWGQDRPMWAMQARMVPEWHHQGPIKTGLVNPRSDLLIMFIRAGPS